MKYPIVREQSVLYSAQSEKIDNDVTHCTFQLLRDECAVCTIGEPPHQEEATRLAADTAIWGYDTIRTRPFYWMDKTKLLKRIFRTTNITLWQKQRELGFDGGVYASLAVAIFGTTRCWVGILGLPSVYVYHRKTLHWIVDTRKTDKQPLHLGNNRYGVMPTILVAPYEKNDVILLSNQPLLPKLSEKLVCGYLSQATQQTLDETIQKILASYASKDLQLLLLTKKIE